MIGTALAVAAVTLVAGIALALLASRLPSLRGRVIALALIAVGLPLAAVLASGVLMVLLLFGLNMSYGFFVESRAKRQIAGRFGQYVPPELVEEMSRHPERFSMEGVSREMSVLFSDVRGFTTISEGLDPKELSQLMNQFLTPLTQVIYRRRGTIDPA